jgi:RNA polymerase sigma-70 factor (ECF subfamily)
MNEKQRDSPTHLPDPATWVDQHGDFLFRYALSRLGNRAVAEDLVQETFLAALRAERTFAGRSAERTWFVGILKHKIIDHLRRQGRERPLSAVNSSEEMSEELFDKKGWWQVKPAKWPADPSEVLETKEFWEAFRHCLEDLPQRLAAVFSLREMDELSTDEVCDALKVTPGNLGVLLYRARMGLRRCLEINWFSTKTEEG